MIRHSLRPKPHRPTRLRRGLLPHCLIVSSPKSPSSAGFALVLRPPAFAPPHIYSQNPLKGTQPMNYLVQNAPAFGVIVTGLGVIVTVVLFLVQSSRQKKDARVAARKQIVSRVLDTVERASRAYALYPLSKVWTRSEMEVVLVLPRLILELEPEDRDIAAWVGRQVQRMQLQTSDKAALQIAQTLAFQLAEWHHGNRPLAWFRSELVADPYDMSFTVPTSNSVKRWLRQLRDTGFVLGALGMLRWTWRRTFHDG